MKTRWIFSAAVCLATFQLVVATPIDAKKKTSDVLPKDVSVDEKLPKEELKIDQILKQDDKPQEVKIVFIEWITD